MTPNMIEPAPIAESVDSLDAGSLREAYKVLVNEHQHLAASYESLVRQQVPAEQEPAAPFRYSYPDALRLCEQGLAEWRGKMHNKQWWKKIDGTPIPNDLLSCIASVFSKANQVAPQPEQSELVAAVRGVLSAEHLEHAQAIANGALGRYWAALSAQGSAGHE